MVKFGQRNRALKSYSCRALSHFGFALSSFTGKAAAAHLSAGDKAPMTPSLVRGGLEQTRTRGRVAVWRCVLVEPLRRRALWVPESGGRCWRGPWASLAEGSACLVGVKGRTRWPRPGPPVCSLVTLARFLASWAGCRVWTGPPALARVPAGQLCRALIQAYYTDWYQGCYDAPVSRMYHCAELAHIGMVL